MTEVREAQSPDIERETWRDRAAYWGYRAAERAGRSLPEATGRFVFTRFGSLAFRTMSRTRAVVAANQAQVLGRPEADPLVRASTLEAFRLYARYWADSFHLPEVTDEEILDRVACDTVWRFGEALALGRGAIVALPHMGNWDVAGRWMTALGYPVVAVAEELRPARLYHLFLEHRRRLGMDIVPLSGSQVGRQLQAALSANRVVALVADRDLTGRGIEVEMFGRRRRIPAGPALLSITSSAPLFVTPVFTTEKGWRIDIQDPGVIQRTGDRRRDAVALATMMARAFERAIAAAPADWHMFQPGWES